MSVMAYEGGNRALDSKQLAAAVIQSKLLTSKSDEATGMTVAGALVGVSVQGLKESMTEGSERIAAVQTRLVEAGYAPDSDVVKDMMSNAQAMDKVLIRVADGLADLLR